MVEIDINYSLSMIIMITRAPNYLTCFSEAPPLSLFIYMYLADWVNIGRVEAPLRVPQILGTSGVVPACEKFEREPPSGFGSREEDRQSFVWL
jgi:hypothetical protein